MEYVQQNLLEIYLIDSTLFSVLVYEWMFLEMKQKIHGTMIKVH